MEETIGMVAVILPFVTAVINLLIIFVTKVMRDRSRNQVIMKAIEAGKEISPDMFTTPETEKKSDPLTSALVSIGVGVGMFGAFYFFFGGLKFAAFGLIPFFIGVGQLVAYFVNKNRKDTQL